MSTFGPAYEENIDGKRIKDQRNAILRFMIDGVYRPLYAISQQLGIPEASVSAQLRHLRKEKFGGYRVDKKRVGVGGLWTYRVLPPIPPDANGQLRLI